VFPNQVERLLGIAGFSVIGAFERVSENLFQPMPDDGVVVCQKNVHGLSGC
jgi:hypothetical protein